MTSPNDKTMGKLEEKPVWIMRAGQYGQDEATALEEGLAIIGFLRTPDLSKVKSRDEITSLLENGYTDASKLQIGNFASQLSAFVLRSEPGDVVALPFKSKPGRVALGRITGPYEYREIGGEKRHVRSVEWIRTDMPRSIFRQDLQFSLGAAMTICRISRNDAEYRFAAIINGNPDPGQKGTKPDKPTSDDPNGDGDHAIDVAEIAHNQILTQIETRFKGHDLTRLIAAILKAQGYATRESPAGPDGGVDILAGRGALGLDSPCLCVQVKSSTTPQDVTIFRALQGTMQSFSAEQGLLVCWGGFTRPLQKEANQSFFTVRLWDASDVVSEIYSTYDKLPKEIQAELPLKQVWALVQEELEE